MNYKVITGDAEHVCKTLDAESFDAVFCDPPYGISFMGSGWDHGVPNAKLWREVLRVCKPGAYLAAFGGTRTYHRLVCAIEDAGFDIRDCLMWLYGSGFPKNHNVSKALDKLAGATREIVGVSDSARPGSKIVGGAGFDGALRSGKKRNSMNSDFAGIYYDTVPATDHAIIWDGFGTALKPAWEPLVLARKNHIESIALNCIESGCGCLNIDGTRIGNEEFTINTFDSGARPFGDAKGQAYTSRKSTGRWPANLVLQHSDECVCTGTEVVKGHKGYPNGPGGKSWFQYSSDARSDDVRPGAWEGIQDSVAESFDCVPGCPVGELRERARYFYSAKASPKEKHAGLEGENPHKTVKPIEMCTYFAKLLLPPKQKGRTRKLLVPFSGSGSEMIGAILAGWDEVIGIEISSEYAEVAEKRLAHWTTKVEKQGNLF